MKNIYIIPLMVLFLAGSGSAVVAGVGDGLNTPNGLKITNISINMNKEKLKKELENKVKQQLDVTKKLAESTDHYLNPEKYQFKKEKSEAVLEKEMENYSALADKLGEEVKALEAQLAAMD